MPRGVHHGIFNNEGNELLWYYNSFSQVCNVFAMDFKDRGLQFKSNEYESMYGSVKNPKYYFKRISRRPLMTIPIFVYNKIVFRVYE